VLVNVRDHAPSQLDATTNKPKPRDFKAGDFEKKEGDIDRNQLSHWTAEDRYPRIFSFLSTDRFGPVGNVLSFGSSTGQEAKTLKGKYFPNAQVDGCDIGDGVIEAAREVAPDARFFVSNVDNLREYGPYDMVFAMSVLTHHPQFDATEYPFRSFVFVAGIIDGAVKKGGILVVYNGSYKFMDTEFGKKYEPIVLPICEQEDSDMSVEEAEEVCQCGFVPAHDPLGTPIENPTSCIFRKIAD
jgi:SAM-dependent methyltransferase